MHKKHKFTPYYRADNQEKAVYPGKRHQLLESKTGIQAGQCDPCQSNWCCKWFGLWPDSCCDKKKLDKVVKSNQIPIQGIESCPTVSKPVLF